MTRFEEKGVELQQNSVTKFQARTRFEHSCELCCTRGMRISCDRCAIRVAHEIAIDTIIAPRIEPRFAIGYAY